MTKGSNRKKRSGEWSKYRAAWVKILEEAPCVHDWQSGSLAEGWQKCIHCDAVRRWMPVKNEA